MKMRLIAAAVGLTTSLAACTTSTTTYQAYTSDGPVAVPGAVAVADEDPIPRAQTIEVAAAGPSLLNSDNKPVQLRSGLNSDPNNPNGAPGGGASFNPY